MSFIDHAEQYLGRVSRGWSERLDGLQVVRFDGSPVPSVDTYLTVGMSRHQVGMSHDRMVRQELVLPLSGEVKAESVVSLLLLLCEFVLKSHDAMLRGQVVRLPSIATDELGFNAVYCAAPVFLEEAFATFYDSEPPTVIVWTLPIMKSEADYVASHGWGKFEDLLETENPDLFAIGREAVV